MDQLTDQNNELQMLQAMTGGRAPGGARIMGSRTRTLGKNAKLMTYEAAFDAPDGTKRLVVVSMLYERRDGQWKSVLHRQMPVDQAQVPVRTSVAAAREL